MCIYNIYIYRYHVYNVRNRKSFNNFSETKEKLIFNNIDIDALNINISKVKKYDERCAIFRIIICVCLC